MGRGMSTVKFPLGDGRVEWTETDVGRPGGSSSRNDTADETISSSTTIREMTGASSNSRRGHLGSSLYDDQVHRGSHRSSQHQRVMTAYPRFRVNSMNAVLPASRKWAVEEVSQVEDENRLIMEPGSGLPRGAEGGDGSLTTRTGTGFPLGHPNIKPTSRPPPGKMRMRIRSIDPSLYPRQGSRLGNITGGSSSLGCSTPTGPASPIKGTSGEMIFSPPGSPRKFRVRRSSGVGSSADTGNVVESDEERKRLRDRRDKACNTVKEMGESEERFRNGLNVVIDVSYV
jgi:hypothetical protein